MKWLIAEDEEIEREGLKKLMQQAFPDLEVVGEATTGKEAVELAKKTNPDIITMDIKMPVMDGVEAVHHIKSWRNDVEIIMMTAYDEFQYARDVMREGVQEYVLKPARKKELIETFQRAMKAVEAKNQHVHQVNTTMLSMIQSDMLQAYFTERALEYYPDQLASFFPMAKGRGCVILIRLMDQENSDIQYNWLREWFERHTHCLMGPIQDQHIPIWIFSFKDEQVAESITSLGQWVRTAIQLFFSQFHQQVKMGIGSFCEKPDQLIHSYHEAVIALSSIPSKKGYIHYELAKSQLEPGAFHQVVQEKHIYDAIRAGDADLAIHQFEQWWALMREQDDVSERCRNILYTIAAIVKEMGFTEEPRFIDFSSKPLDAYRRFVVERLSHAASVVKSWKRVTSKDALWNAEEWIKEHYDQSITLEQIAEHVNLSPYYFSKLFKDRFEQSFIDYVTELRVAKAKELLRATDKPLKEICSLVGYKDPNYFSRVFKKKTGQTPSDFRDSIHLTSK
ncbi:response regulator [Pontibacillus salicampi]|uniref:Response regulator n=1 Tax=Pontibacillus salicampi TaxID=1449801 RepID=A0ABV6LLT8_9BACI